MGIVYRHASTGELFEKLPDGQYRRYSGPPPVPLDPRTFDKTLRSAFGPELSGALDEAANQPAPEPEPQGALSQIGGQLADAAAYHIPAGIAAPIEGEEFRPFDERSIGDRLIERSRARAAERAAVPGSSETISSLGPSLGFSIPAMGAGLAAGVGTTLASAPVFGPGALAAGYTAGGLASGGVAYRASKNQFLRDAFDDLNAKAVQSGRPKITPEEWAQAEPALKEAADTYGKWEAIPEGISNMIGFGILKLPVKALVPKMLASVAAHNPVTRIGTKVAAMQVPELATETVTQMGQKGVESAAGLTTEPPRSFADLEDWKKSLAEIVGPTMLQTALLGGGAAGVQEVARALSPGQPSIPAQAPVTPPSALTPSATALPVSTEMPLATPEQVAGRHAQTLQAAQNNAAVRNSKGEDVTPYRHPTVADRYVNLPRPEKAPEQPTVDVAPTPQPAPEPAPPKPSEALAAIATTIPEPGVRRQVERASTVQAIREIVTGEPIAPSKPEIAPLPEPIAPVIAQQQTWQAWLQEAGPEIPQQVGKWDVFRLGPDQYRVEDSMGRSLPDMNGAALARKLSKLFGVTPPVPPPIEPPLTPVNEQSIAAPQPDPVLAPELTPEPVAVAPPEPVPEATLEPVSAEIPQIQPPNAPVKDDLDAMSLGKIRGFARGWGIPDAASKTKEQLTAELRARRNPIPQPEAPNGREQVQEEAPQIPPPAAVSVADIHAKAAELGIPSDNDPAFAARTKALIGKEHLDDATPAERRVVFDNLIAEDRQPKPAALTTNLGRRKRGPLDRKSDERTRSILDGIKGQGGWFQQGNRLRMEFGPEGRFDLDTGVVGQQEWVANAPWWHGIQTNRPLPKNTGGKATRIAIDKYLANQSMSPAERDHVDGILDYIEGELAQTPNVAPEVGAAVITSEPEYQAGELAEADLVAKAGEIDQQAVEKASIQYENDDAAFMAEVRRIYEQGKKTDANGQETGGETGRAPGEEETALSQPNQQYGKQPDTPAFKNWFGDSKVVDAEGEPLVVYHGTADDITAFDLNHPNRKDTGWLGTGVYLTTESSMASSYSLLKGGGAGSNVMPVYARLVNPYKATRQDKWKLQQASMGGAEAGREASDKWTRELKAKGYDGVTLEYTAGEVGKNNASTEIIVFDPAGVKSAIGNRGAFDPNKPSIIEQPNAPYQKPIPSVPSPGMAAAARQLEGELAGKKPKPFALTSEQRTPEESDAELKQEALATQGDLLGGQTQAAVEAKARETAKRQAAAPGPERFELRQGPKEYTPPDESTMVQGRVGADRNAADRSADPVRANRPADLQQPEVRGEANPREPSHQSWIAKGNAALTVEEQIARKGSAALLGQDVSTPEKLASIAQVLRDTTKETFRWFFVKDGKVIHATAVSSGQPGRTELSPAGVSEADYIQSISDEMSRLGADGFYILHNHPAGNPRASPSDRRATRRVAEAIDGFLGHIIIDSNAYSALDRGGGGMVIEADFGPDLLLTPEVPSELIGQSVTEPKNVADIGFKLKKPGWVVLIGTSGETGVRAIQEVPSSQFATDGRSLLNNFAEASGADKIFAYGAAADLKGARALMDEGYIFEAVDDTGKSYHAEKPADTTRYMGRKISELATVVDQTSSPYEANPPASTPAEAQWGSTTWVQKFKLDFDRVLLDKMNLWKEYHKYLIAQGYDVDESVNVHQIEQQMSSRAMDDIKQAAKKYVEPMMKSIKESGLTLEFVGTYALARHAQEGNNAIDERYAAYTGMNEQEALQFDMKKDELANLKADAKRLKGRGTGMPTSREFAEDGEMDAQTFIKNLTTEQRASLDKIMAPFDAMLQARRERMVEVGLITPGTAESWEQKFEFYVPIKTIDPKGRLGLSQGYAVTNTGVKARLGRSSLPSNPVLQAIVDTNRMFVEARKLEVGQVIHKLAVDYPTDMVKSVTQESLKVRLPVRNPKTGKLEVVERLDPNLRARDDIFAVRVEGKVELVQIKDALLYRQAKNLGDQKFSDLFETLLQVVSGVTKFIGQTITSWNFEWLQINFTKDIQTALINIQAIKDVDTVKVAKAVAKGIPASWRAISQSIWVDGAAEKLEAKLGNTPADWIELDKLGGKDQQKLARLRAYREFEQDGVPTGHYGMDDIETIARRAERGFRLATSKAHGATEAVWNAIVRGIVGHNGVLSRVREINEVVENATRFSTYYELRKNGVTRQQSAILSKNLTVNFNKRGEAGRVLNALYMFFNASVQGSKIMVQAMKSPKVIKVMMGMMATGYIIETLNYLLGGDDDETGEPMIDKKASEWTRDHYVTIMIGRDQNAIKPMALPYGYNLPYVIGRRVAAATWGHDSIMDAVGGVARAAFDAFNPMGGADSKTLSNWMLKTMAPTILDPISDVALNENFMGGWIYKESKFDRVPPPPSETALRSTSPAITKIAQAVNKWTGGNADVAGIVSINPGAFEHLIKGYLGGLGSTLMVGIDAPFESKKDRSVAKIPLVRKVIAAEQKGFTARRYREVEDELYPILEELKKGPSKQPADVRRIVGEFRQTDREIMGLRRKLSDMRNKGAPEAAIERHQEQIERVQSRMLRSYNQWKHPPEVIQGAKNMNLSEAKTYFQSSGMEATASLLETLPKDLRLPA